MHIRPTATKRWLFCRRVNEGTDRGMENGSRLPPSIKACDSVRVIREQGRIVCCRMITSCVGVVSIRHRIHSEDRCNLCPTWAAKEGDIKHFYDTPEGTLQYKSHTQLISKFLMRSSEEEGIQSSKLAALALEQEIKQTTGSPILQNLRDSTLGTLFNNWTRRHWTWWAPRDLPKWNWVKTSYRGISRSEPAVPIHFKNRLVRTKISTDFRKEEINHKKVFYWDCADLSMLLKCSGTLNDDIPNAPVLAYRSPFALSTLTTISSFWRLVKRSLTP